LHPSASSPFRITSCDLTLQESISHSSKI
jgi:hypothetical protein